MDSMLQRFLGRKMKEQEMAITLKNKQQIEMMRESGKLVAHTLAYIGEQIAPGITTADLDKLVYEELSRHDAKPSFLGYKGFPASTCTSVNEVICHGIPEPRRLEEGDIIGVDIGAILNGWHGDSCVTFPVGQISAEARKLLDATRDALEKAILVCRPGARLGDIGAAIQAHVEPLGFSVVREYTGHGIGRRMHEDGPTIFHHGREGTGMAMRAGMTFTIEPMINAGRPDTKVLSDGWTVVTVDGSLSAQFEHTVAITDDGALVLSRP